MAKQDRHLYEFGPFCLDSEDRLLLRDGQPVDANPQAVELLFALVEKAGRVVTKEELKQRIWPKTSVGETSLPQAVATLRRVLNAGSDPEEFVQTIPRRGYRFTADVRDVFRAETARLDSCSTEAPTASVPDSPVGPWIRRWRFGSIFLSLVCAVVLVSFFAARRVRPALVTTKADSSVPVFVAPRRSVAVFGIRNASARPRDAWLSTALSEMLTTELAAGEKFRVLSQERVARLKADLSIGDTKALSNEELSHVHAVLGADLVVSGTYVILDENKSPLRLDLSIQDVKSGEVVASAAETGLSTDLFEIVSRAGARLRDKLHMQEVSREEAESIKASMPSSRDATRFYAQGLTALRSFDLLAARDLFKRAVVVEPQFPLAHIRLAEDWSILGYDEHAKEEARRAFDLSGNLSQEERLWVEGNYREMAKEWDLAIEIYRRLWGFFPDDSDYGLELASVQTTAEKQHDALAVLETLRRLPVPEGDRARIDLAEAMANDNVDQGRELEAARRARAEGESQDARFLVARARLLESYAYGDSGHEKEAIDSAVIAQRLFAATEDKAGYARAIIYEANVLRSGGTWAKRKRLYEEALGICQSIGNKRCEAGALNNLAGVLEDWGDLSGAKRRYEESLAVRHAVNDKRGTATALNNIGTVLQVQWDLAGARRAYKQALDIYRSVGAKPEEGMALSNIAEISELRGDLGQANKTMKESLAIWQQLGTQKIYAAFPRAGMGDLLFLAGDLDGAEGLYEQAISIAASLGDTSTSAEMRMRLAEVLIERNRLAEAEKILRECGEIFRGEKKKNEEGLTEALLLRILLREGRLQEARSEAQGTARLSFNAYGAIENFPLAIMLAEVQAAIGNVAGATKSLNEVLNVTAKYGLVEYALQARLALGEIEMRSGNARGLAALGNLYIESRKRGFGKIAHEAERALHGDADIQASAPRR